MGGKPSECPKNIVFKTRIDRDTDMILSLLSKRYDVSKSEIIRRALADYYYRLNGFRSM